jgi:uncharacterized membrane protein
MTDQNAFGAYLRDKRALIATAIIAASFLPFSGAGSNATSLVGIQGQVNAAKQALRLMGGMLGPRGLPSIDDITGGLNLLMILYLIPVSAVVVALMAFAARGTRFWGAVNGIMAIALPIAVPIIAGELFLAALPRELRILIDQQGGGVDFTSFGIGVWVIVALGAAQLLFSFRQEQFVVQSGAALQKN